MAKRSSRDHLRAWSATLMAYRRDAASLGMGAPPSDKIRRHEADIEKLIQVLTKISDVLAFEDEVEFFLDVAWYLHHHGRDYKSSSVWALLALLTKWSAQSGPIRSLLAQPMGLAPFLTQLYLTLPPTSHERGLKVLALLRHVTAAHRPIRRCETFALDLVPKLVELIPGPAGGEGRSHSLFILTSLCRGSRLMSKLVLSHLSEEQRKGLIIQHDEDPKVKVLTRHLNFCLGRLNLSFHATALAMFGNEAHLSTLCDALCAAYAEEETLLMERFGQFLSDIIQEASAHRNSDAEVSSPSESSTLHMMQQIILVMDYQEGTNVFANEIMFGFLRRLLKWHKELISNSKDSEAILDLVLKAVHTHLDAPKAYVKGDFEAISLLEDAISWFQSHGTMDLTQRQNVRLQLEPIIAILVVALESSSEGQASTQEAILRLFGTITRVGDDWHELIRSKVPCNRFRRLLENESNPTLLAEMFVFAKGQSESCTDEDWKRLYETCLSDQTITQVMTGRLQSSSCSNVERNLILHVMSNGTIERCRRVSLCNPEELQTGESEEDKRKFQDIKGMKGDDSRLGLGSQTSSCFSSSSGSASSSFCISNSLPNENQILAIENALNMVCKATQSGDLRKVDSVVPELLDLGDYRLSSQQRKIDSLKSALKSSDERIQHQNEQIATLETELSKTFSILRLVSEKAQNLELDLEDVRLQFESLEMEATNFRTKANKAIQAKDVEIQDLETDRTKITAKALKYKEQNETLQSAIKEHVQAGEELQHKLKIEAKMNADLTTALEKREEKLKKKERQIEDEMSHREQLSVDLETARKECASLQTLTKRQEQALAKKDKLLADQNNELSEARRIQEQIFNLSKVRNASS
ncbi:uncharacterized protein LOC131890871 [Tigriopus californicus]|uniref:uncharacterized protein LOC131890871 n=1 Tax=Tigriopus californicus TaxID=6832 RepID=UPI0027D9D5C5|nr:uncharacterized protein LOC131890871 [Tigriopus californicus]